MNLEAKIKQLETEFDEKIKALKAEMQREDEFPRDGDEYWFMDYEGGMFSTFYENHYLDIYRQKIGNIFHSKEQAKFAIEKLKVEAELRKFSRPFEYGRFNYYLFFNIESDSLDTQFTSYCPPQGAIYFESEEKAIEAIETVGKERIKKYIFGMED